MTFRLSALQTIPGVVYVTLELQRQECVLPESDDGRLLSLGQDRRARFSWPGFEMLDHLPLAPFRHRFLFRRTGLQKNGGPALIVAALTTCVVMTLP